MQSLTLALSCDDFSEVKYLLCYTSVVYNMEITILAQHSLKCLKYLKALLEIKSTLKILLATTITT